MINIAVGSDDGYAPHAATLIHSLAAVHGRDKIKIYYYCDSSLSAGVRAVLAAYCDKLGVGLRFMEIDPARFQGLHANERLPLLCWYRVCLADFLPEVDRILYLDTDIVALEPVDEIFNMDMGDKLAGVVNDHLAAIAFPEVAKRVNIPYEDYFNSGVMLLNLKAIREAGGGDRILKIARANMDRLYFPDQDALNLALGPRSIMLDPRWNYPPITAKYFEHYRGNPMIESLPASRRVVSPDFKPALLHFLAQPKPWVAFDAYEYVWEYHRHRAHTPWAPPLSGTLMWWMRTHMPWMQKAWRALRGGKGA
jgi:lipopolysaccharide biosynthesis glycosyltransferase